MKKLLAAVATGALLSATLLTATPAYADEPTCRGSLGAVTVDNLRVPSGATCFLNGTRVKGTITVQSTATLRAYRVGVVGNVQAEGHTRVNLQESTVGGSVQLKQGRAADIRGNRVTGDVQLFTNRATQIVQSNNINGNLQGKENSPAPTGGKNAVRGDKEDQCRRL